VRLYGRTCLADAGVAPVPATCTKTDQEKRLVQQDIEATDVRIDALVYELFGLTEEEIKMVDGSVGR